MLIFFLSTALIYSGMCIEKCISGEIGDIVLSNIASATMDASCLFSRKCHA